MRQFGEDWRRMLLVNSAAGSAEAQFLEGRLDAGGAQGIPETADPGVAVKVLDLLQE